MTEQYLAGIAKKRGPRPKVATAEKRERAIALRIDGQTLQEIGQQLGVSKQRVSKYLKGTIGEGVHLAKQRMAQEAKAALKEQRAADKANQLCKTCGRPLRIQQGYARGECGTCRSYRFVYGTSRPERLWNELTGKPRQRGPRACLVCDKVTKIVAHERCKNCYTRWRRAQERQQRAQDVNPCGVTP